MIVIGTFLPDKSPCLVIMRHETCERLATKCFRKTEKPLSGNFAFWNDLLSMWKDADIRSSLLDDVMTAILEANDFPTTTQRLEIDYGSDVGWSSTSRRIDGATHNSWRSPNDEIVDNRLVETFEPNKKSTALRVRLDRTDIKAPLTNRLTIVYELKFEPNHGWVVVIHSVYPGENVGLLRGDVTAREGVVFFDFNHPGEVRHLI